VDDAADQGLVLFQARPGPADHILEHRHVALVGDGGAQQLAQQRRNLDPLKLAAQGALGQAAEPLRIERFQHVAEDAGDAGAQPRRLPAAAGRIGQEAAQGRGDVHPVDAPGDDRRGQEVVLEEQRHGVSDAVLVDRDDRRVRDRHAKRVAEQRGDSEPIGHAAHHAGFGKGENEAPGRVAILQRPGDQIKDGHGDQQPGGEQAHPPPAVAPGGQRPSARPARAHVPKSGGAHSAGMTSSGASRRRPRAGAPRADRRPSSGR
jgi:hypothetical protein